ncbi:MAG: M20/M25/M40 family metallo-hydrolase [Anaerolineae bacterium]|nr:M20/M25/M40 family metallo-hydrolase [Anaerolineae bacterium]
MKQLIEKYHQQLDWSWLPEGAQWSIEQAIAVQQIPAPTFEEKLRATYVADQFAALGLRDIEIDNLYNVYGRLAGKHDHRPGVMVSAHTDTVFAGDTDLKIRRENGLIYGPGLGDNSMGVAGMLCLAYCLQRLGIRPECDLWFVANTREEGLGDLGGMKAAFQRLKNRISSVVNLEGMAFGHVYHAGIAVRRLHITAQAEGGHSWLNFGRSSAIHGVIELGAKIMALNPAQQPRTTFNIGLIEGGQSINTIAAEAGFWLDLRSEQSSELAKIEEQVRQLVKKTERADLRFQIEVVGDRPAGMIAPEHPLVRGALAALEIVGLRGTLENGSTDANVPLAMGYPAVTVGITRGGNAHRLDEYIETQPIAAGLHQLVVLTLAACAFQTL